MDDVRHGAGIDRPATAAEIREILGDLGDDAVMRIADIGATSAEILEAQTWMASDDYLHRARHHTLDGKAAMVFDILESELPEEPNA